MAALAELAPLLVLVATFLLAYAMLQGYRFSLRPLLVGIAWIVQHFAVALPLIGRIGPGPWLAKQVRALDRLILVYLSGAVDFSVRAIVALWNGSARLMEWVADEIGLVARDAAGAVERLGSVGLRGLSKRLRKLIDLAAGRVYRRLLRLIGSLTRGLGKRIIGAVSAIYALAKLFKHFRGYTAKQFRAALRRLARLGWLTGVGSIAALGHLIFRKLGLRWLTGHKTMAAFGIAMLARLGLSWVRCGNVSRLGKAACTNQGDWLDDLLFGAIALTGTISVVQMARELQEIEGAALGIIRAGIDELP